MEDAIKQVVRAFLQPGGVTEFHVQGIAGWQEFESIVEFICRHFSAKVTDKLDGICSRTWRMRTGGVDFIMKHHDDIGNYFFSEDGSAGTMKQLEAIAEALNRQLEGAK